MASWSRSGSSPENGVYEAENARSEVIGGESSRPGFTGRGYLAGWNAADQALTIHVNVGRARPHQLRFRYAAGAGDAGRRILVNGAQATDLRFPATEGGWDQWGTAVLDGVRLARGHNTIRMELGGGNYLNLDAMTLRRQTT
ncbi:CBM35 domain-containing protein [Nonomuraea diastatica]|uniref:CBM35 domain-containing protein n=1 Tax=Nonomuraea diastatica TaxID=1848329 RepID=UPI0024828BE0|nr:CBM35 domain-containing protein [Nonomuraea diastatica]